MMTGSRHKLRVGIAGLGIVGKRRQRFIDMHPDLQTVGVADRTFESAGEMDDGVLSFSTYEDLLKLDLDALFVCLTNDVAADVTIAGLQRDLHVFCEKPPGRDVADIRRVIAVEKQKPGLKLKYGFNHRYHDSVIDALNIVRSGDLGDVINLRGVYGKSAIINFESDWRTKRSLAGGGILLDQGIHMVDLMRLFAGEFTEIHSFVSNGHWNHDVEDNAYALMRTDDGKVALLHSTATQWRHRFNLEIALSEGAIILDGLLTGSKSYGAETMTVVRKTRHDCNDPEEQTNCYDKDPSWQREVDEFAEAIIKDVRISNGSSLDALNTMETVFRIYCADPDWAGQFGISRS